MAIYSEYEKQIWDALNADIQNDYGVAGMMGNLYAESSLFPGRVEGDFTSGYTISVNYTNMELVKLYTNVELVKKFS